MSLYKAVEDVAAFHVVTELPILAVPQWPNDARIDLRFELIEEEVTRELLPAIERRDLVETADAIVDSIYVLIGAALEFGIPIGNVWTAVQAANMAKAVENEDGTRRVRRREDGKILKPAGWQAPDIREVLLAAGWIPPKPKVIEQTHKEWLERSINLLARHYSSFASSIHVLPGCTTIYMKERIIGEGETFSLAVENAVVAGFEFQPRANWVPGYVFRPWRSCARRKSGRASERISLDRI